MAEFANKVVIVTGGSSGFGAATAEAFAKRGATLVLTGRNEERLGKVVEACKSHGVKVAPVLANFENLDEVKNIVDECIKHFGKIDVLINNAGLVRTGNLENSTMENFDVIFNVNVKAQLYLTQIAMPHLVKTKGNIVNVSSISGVKQFPGSLMYGMSKAAIDQFTKTVALEYAGQGVRVNSVNPSLVVTDIYRDSGWSSERIQEQYKLGDSAHPSGRIGTVEEVANAIVFLASDASSWTTGQLLLLDGGRSLTTRQIMKPDGSVP